MEFLSESQSGIDLEAGEENAPQVVRAAIAGATGYAGRELILLLARHPKARITQLLSSGRSGKGPFPIHKSHPGLRGRDLPECRPFEIEELSSSSADVVFLATPHEMSHEVVPQLLDRGLRVIDLSGAFRLKSRESYTRWYGFRHSASAALAEAVYGIPELNGAEVARARLVSNPGCYATSVILGLAPLVRAGWADLAAGVICDSKSGASGAGRAPTEKLHFTEANENCRAYGLFYHRHVPEMLQALEIKEESFTFTPHLLPITRGILSTIYLRLSCPRTAEQVAGLFRSFYESAPLVRVYEPNEIPEIQSVAHTNLTDIGFVLDEATRRLIVVSALDNLGKGAAGQAVQNMNLMFGLPEESGLR